MSELRLEIPGMNPPSVGHYNAYRVVTPHGKKPFVQCYPTAKAKAWWDEVSRIAAGRKIRDAGYTVSLAVFTPTARVCDLDNMFKCVLDGLARAGVIDNDKNVIDLHGFRRIDRQNPRTVIIVRSAQEQLLP